MIVRKLIQLWLLVRMIRAWKKIVSQAAVKRPRRGRNIMNGTSISTHRVAPVPKRSSQSGNW